MQCGGATQAFTAQLKEVGFTIEQLKEAGFTTAKDLKRAGCSAADLKESGFTATELKEAGFISSYNPSPAVLGDTSWVLKTFQLFSKVQPPP